MRTEHAISTKLLGFHGTSSDRLFGLVVSNHFQVPLRPVLNWLNWFLVTGSYNPIARARHKQMFVKNWARSLEIPLIF